MQKLLLVCGFAVASSIVACAGASDELDPAGDDGEVASALEMRSLTVRPDVELAASFAGFGAQYNQNVFADVSKQDGVTEANVPTLEGKLRRLRPGYVRIFWDAGASADEHASFLRTVGMAQRNGASINVTYWHGPYKNPPAQMKAFAQILGEVLGASGAPSALDVTIQNEVNTTPCVTQEVYAALYVALDGELRTMGLRGKVRFIGGDLLRGGTSEDTPAAFAERLQRCVDECGWSTSACSDKAQADGSTQEAWLRDFATRPVVGVPGAAVLADMFAGYSAHVYWNYWDRTKMVTRLDGLRAAIEALPPRFRKPLYVTEYGARGDVSKAPTPGLYDASRPAKDADGTPFVASDGYPMADTYVEAFQTGRFAVEALKRGVVAAVRWDAYDAHYHPSPGGNFSILKQGSTDWTATPSYGVAQLFGETGMRGWSVVAVDGDSREGVVAAALASAGGGRTVYVANDTATIQRLTIRGLPRGVVLRVLQWSRAEGTTRAVRSTKSDASGAATLDVPMHALVALTTLPP